MSSGASAVISSLVVIKNTEVVTLLPQLRNVVLLQCYSATVLQCYNSTGLHYYSSTILQYYSPQYYSTYCNVTNIQVQVQFFPSHYLLFLILHQYFYYCTSFQVERATTTVLQVVLLLQSTTLEVLAAYGISTA